MKRHINKRVLARYISSILGVSIIAYAQSGAGPEQTILAPVPATNVLEIVNNKTVVQFDHDESSYVQTSNYVFTVADARTGIAARSYLVRNMNDTIVPNYYWETNIVNGATNRASRVMMRVPIAMVVTNTSPATTWQLAVASQDNWGEIWGYSNWLHMRVRQSISAPRGITILPNATGEELMSWTTNQIGTIIIVPNNP